MATLSTTYPNLLDLARRQDPDGTIAAVAEVLDETSEMLEDIFFVEGNLPTGHRTTVRTGLPMPTWRKIGGGVQPTKSTTAQITHTAGMLEAYAEVDVKLAALNGNTAEWRLSEDRPHIEGIDQELQETLIYGNEKTEPEAFTGLSPHYNDLSAASGANIIDAGGTGSDNGSIWMVVWDSTTIHGIIPKGSTAGLQIKNLGEVTIEDVDGAGGRMQALRTHYKLEAGLAVRDWRYGVRIANIDKSLLTATLASGQNVFTAGADLPALMFRAMRRVPSLRRGRVAFYMSRDIATWVAEQAIAKGFHGLIRSENVGGDMKFTEKFHGIPMRRVDALGADEAQVT